MAWINRASIIRITRLGLAAGAHVQSSVCIRASSIIQSFRKSTSVSPAKDGSVIKSKGFADHLGITLRRVNPRREV
jgi:hypothetical protein